MRIVVVHDSSFGNTARIAQAARSGRTHAGGGLGRAVGTAVLNVSGGAGLDKAPHIHKIPSSNLVIGSHASKEDVWQLLSSAHI